MHQADNPYRWDEHEIRHWVARDVGLDDEPANVETLAQALRQGRSVALFGGRGLGKSTFLRKLCEHLEADTTTRVVLIDEPPGERTKKGCVDTLAEELDVPTSPTGQVKRVINAWRERHPGHRLVLLYDEVDRYAGDSARPERFGVDFFSGIASARASIRELGVLVAGGLGLYLVGSEATGSTLLSRSTRYVLRNFSMDELVELARPFDAEDQSLDREVMESLRVITGGNPLLSTYFLQGLWAQPAAARTPDRLSRLQRRSDKDLGGFLNSFRGALEGGPWSVLEYLLAHDQPPYSREELEEVLESTPDAAPVSLDDALEVLQAAGLCRLDRTPGPSIWVSLVSAPMLMMRDTLRAEEREGAAASLSLQLRRDLLHILRLLQRWSPDLIHRNKVVSESVCAVTLAVSLNLLGWSQVEREALQGAGRTDLKLTHPAHDGHAVVEVKIWGRNDHQEIHAQVRSYVAADTAALAAVTVRLGGGRAYREACLGGFADENIAVLGDLGPGIEGYEVRTDGEAPASVDHLQLTLSRR